MDDILHHLVHGQLASYQLPQTLNVWDLKEDLGDLRRHSLDVPATAQVEWGGCIVLQAERLRLMHQVSGWTEGVSPKCRPEDQEHEYYVGFAHIHLPDAVTGQPYPGFSEKDFRGTLADGDQLSLVCNGPEVFALVRTKDRTLPCQMPDSAEFAAWEQLYDEAIEQARREMAAALQAGHKGSNALNRALWQVNRKLCKDLGFALYRGLWGQPLIRVFRP